jgi:hypothetical protein
MKTLIIHHLEPMWNEGYKTHNTNFEELLEKFYNYLTENIFDRVILTRFEDHKLDDSYCFYSTENDEYVELSNFINKVHTYDYGWCKDSVFDGELPEQNQDGFYVNEWGNVYCDGGMHSEIVWIPEWMKDLKGDIFISGAFDGECIDDLETALSALNKTFYRINELII